MSGILGIDLGTSSVKLLLHDGETTLRAREEYQGRGVDSWFAAIRRAAGALGAASDSSGDPRLGKIDAIGLSAQVGTYIVDGGDVIGWDSGLGGKELSRLKGHFSEEDFLREISMPHPDIASYPAPRLLCLKERYGASRVCQPKDLLCEALTGRRVTDMYSWRGLTNLRSGAYSRTLLDYLGISAGQLPEIVGPTSLVGRTIRNQLGLPEGIPVYAGCNDFFASLVGMGIHAVGDMFDITGTSEHIGRISDGLGAGLVSGPYFFANVQYGVTQSSGASLGFGCQNFGSAYDISSVFRDPPVFLPYLNGERMPVRDPNARGVFFAISGRCGGEELAYSVAEGVAFSLYHICESLGPQAAPREGGGFITVSGGAAKDDMLNRIKAELFGLPVRTLAEHETSALGAVLLAAVGAGQYDSIERAMSALCREARICRPSGEFREKLLERFRIYKEIYPSVKHLFKGEGEQ